jgi:hypothetical protein
VHAPTVQGQPATSLVQAAHVWLAEQASPVSHWLLLHAQPSLPGVQLPGWQVPPMQANRASHVLSVRHGQPASPALQVTHVLLEHLRPAVLHWPLSRQVQASAPREQVVHTLPTHSPAAHSEVAPQLPPSGTFSVLLQLLHAGSSATRRPARATFHPRGVMSMECVLRTA